MPDNYKQLTHTAEEIDKAVDLANANATEVYALKNYAMVGIQSELNNLEKNKADTKTVEELKEEINKLDKEAEDIYKKSEVDEKLSDKVEKIEGKGLSANDFDNKYKSKVDNTYTKSEVDLIISPINEKATKNDADIEQLKSDLAETNHTVENNKSDLQGQIDALVLEAGGDSNPEVVQARVRSDGTIHDTLKARLDATDTTILDCIYRRGAITHTNHSTNNINNVFDFKENSIYAITADVTEEDISGLPEYGTIANLTRFTPVKSSKNYNVFMYTTLNNAYIGFVYGGSATSVTWYNLTEVNKTSVKAFGIISHDNHSINNINSVFDFKQNSVNAVLYDVTEDDVSGLPMYGVNANVIRFAHTIGNDSCNVWLYTTAEHAYIGYGMVNENIVWQHITDTGFNSRNFISHDNHSANNISNVFDFKQNSTYAVLADVTEEDISGLPEYGTIANLTRFTPVENKKNYNMFMYTTLNNAYIGFVYGESATSVTWHNLTEHEIYKDINTLTRGLGFEQKKIVIVGDSICAGVGGAGYDVSADENRFICTYNEKNYYRNESGHCWANSLKSYLETNYPNCTVVNNGIGGMNTIWMNDIKTSIIPEDTDIVISYVGTNNRASAYTIESTIASLQSFYDYCKSKGIEVIFVSPARVISTREDFDKTSYGINSLIKAICADNNIYCANLFEKMEQYYYEHDITLDTSFLPDYLHPNDKMYDIMFAMIKSLLAV